VRHPILMALGIALGSSVAVVKAQQPPASPQNPSTTSTPGAANGAPSVEGVAPTAAAAATGTEAQPADGVVAPRLSRAAQLKQLTKENAAQQAELATQRERIEKLEALLQGASGVQGAGPALKASAPAAKAPKEAAPAEAAPAETERAAKSSAERNAETSEDPRKGIVVTGYIQGEYRWDDSSEDELGQSGNLLNLDRFLVRRTRLVAEREFKWVSGLLEIDGNTVNGPQVQLQRAEATVFYRLPWDRDLDKPRTTPLIAATLGQFRIPFGFEQTQSPRNRIFMERSTMALAMFPNEIDAGARVAGKFFWFNYSFAAMNGQPMGVQDYPLQDPNSAKDISLHLDVDVHPTRWFGLDAGFSLLVGKGFHAESTATKGQVQWTDYNRDGTFQSNEVAAVAGRTALGSRDFNRFAIGVDAHLQLHTGLGESLLDAELYLGKNMDRGVYVNDPVLLGRDVRQFGQYVAFTQQLGWLIVGVREDSYNPDSDLSDYQGAQLVQPFSQTIQVWSPLIGIQFEKHGRLVAQYDFVRDKLGRDITGEARDLKNDRFTLRMQVSL